MDERCGACKHWTTDDKYFADQFGECKAVIYDAQSHTEKNTCGVESEIADIRSHKAVVCDNGCAAALVSRSDFGCVLYVPKVTGSIVVID